MTAFAYVAPDAWLQGDDDDALAVVAPGLWFELLATISGASSGTFTLSGTASGTVAAGGLLPPGWTITPTLEVVPNPNKSGPGSGDFFSRWTYICTDENGQYVCASGALEDCQAQALTMAQSHTQQQPYNEAV